jgi:hypothetical protein
MSWVRCSDTIASTLGSISPRILRVSCCPDDISLYHGSQKWAGTYPQMLGKLPSFHTENIIALFCNFAARQVVTMPFPLT